MKNNLTRHLSAIFATGIMLLGHAFAEYENAPAQRTPNSYEIGGNPQISFANRVFRSANELRTRHYGRGGLGGSNKKRHECTYSATVHRTGTAAGQPRSHNVSFEIWAQEFRGAESGYVKYAHDFVAQEGLSPTKLGYAGQDVVYFGESWFPGFRLFEQGRDGVWRRADRFEFRTRQAM